LHPGADRRAGIRRIDRPMPPFILGDQGSEHVEAVGLRCAGRRSRRK
jgi:hypothetical protein